MILIDTSLRTSRAPSFSPSSHCRVREAEELMATPVLSPLNTDPSPSSGAGAQQEEHKAGGDHEGKKAAMEEAETDKEGQSTSSSKK